MPLPPDYTGTAFTRERTVRREDLPEAVIPAQAEPMADLSDEAEKIDPEAVSEVPDDPVPWEDTVSVDPAPTPEEAEFCTDVNDTPLIEASADIPPTDFPPPSAETPLLSASLLRSLTLEDLLLYWILLMLLTCDQEDQVYLLLGLLLLNR